MVSNVRSSMPVAVSSDSVTSTQALPATSAQKTFVGNELVVDRIYSALAQDSTVPVDLCKLIQTYYGNHGEAEIERFIRAEYRQVSGGQTLILPGKRVEAFLKGQNIQRETITTLDLSGIAWDIVTQLLPNDYDEAYEQHLKALRDDAEYRKEALNLHRLKYTGPKNILLLKVQELVPNVKTIKMTDWVWSAYNSGGFEESLDSSVANKVVCALGDFVELETIELSYQDVMNHNDSRMGGSRRHIPSDILDPLAHTLARKQAEKSKASYPKLKTIRIIGGVLPDDIQAKLKKARPEIVIECQP